MVSRTYCQNKRLNTLRRLERRTKNNEDLRVHRKNTYYEEETKYQASIKKEKLQSWKEYCNLTPGTNPWNTVNKLASNKTKSSQSFKTLQKTDGSISLISTKL
jgi:hypothetical protein